LSSPLMEVVGVIIASFAIVWLAKQTFADQMETSHFMIMVGLLAAMLDPVRKIANVYNMIQRSGAAATRVFDFLDTPDELSEHGAKRLAGDGPRAICLENVTFRYTPEQEPPALNDVSLRVEPGECIAIVGPNGSGKSTLVKLLPRLIVPQRGRVAVDGIDVGSLSLRSLRQQIAIVSQRPVIFARSVRDNIAYSDDAATLEEVRAAARKAYADEFIEQWPDKYDTIMGEFGATVSGGQRQRIAIARAFLKKSSILIFDEATSEIDADSERKIHAALNDLRRGKTTFLIAHRHTVMEMAERVVVTDAGRIVDVGTQKELLERCPLYVALYRSPPAG
jgi:ABC-type multidrug transport system fused ATPase/permease subunit